MPVILTLSLFLVFLGMRAPHFHKDQRPRLNCRAEIESPTKASQAGIEKQAQVLESGLGTDLIDPASPNISVYPFADRNYDSIVIPTTSARAPPVVHS